MAEKSVNDPSPQWVAMELDRELPRIFLTTGQRGIRDAGTKYLPKYDGEEGTAGDSTSEYGSRLTRTFLVNFYKDAVQNLVGRIFAQPLIFSEDTPQEIMDLWQNVDDCGTVGDIFVPRVAADALGQGISEVLVDFPGAAEFENLAAEDRAGRRPRWVHYKGHEVIEALGNIILGRPYLERARIRETLLESVEYEYGMEQRVREYAMGDLAADPSPGSPYFASYRIHTYSETADAWAAGEWFRMEPSTSGSAEQRALFVEPPLVPFYGEMTGFHEGRPPMLSMSDLNLQHYQLKSNIDNMEYIATVPTLVQEGGDDDASYEVGAHRLLHVPEGASLRWLEIVGNGVQHAKDSLRHLEEHIRLAGREPMVKKATGSELATVRMLDEAQHLTLAQAWAVSWVGSVNRCLELSAAWMGLKRSGTVRIDESVLEALARPEGFESVKELAALGAIGPRVILEEAKRYGVLDRDLDIDEALDEIESSEPAALEEPAAPQVLNVAGLELGE
jgi:hypothetical protein